MTCFPDCIGIHWRDASALKIDYRAGLEVEIALFWLEKWVGDCLVFSSNN